MVLSELQQYLRSHHKVSMSELQQHFHYGSRGAARYFEPPDSQRARKAEKTVSYVVDAVAARQKQLSFYEWIQPVRQR